MNRWFDRAIELAESAEGRAKVGCVALSGNDVVAETTNTYKTHPIQAKYAKKMGLPKKVSLHAELRACILARRPVTFLVVARVSKHGQLKLAKPCGLCQLAMKEAGVEEVWYSTEDGFVRFEHE